MPYDEHRPLSILYDDCSFCLSQLFVAKSDLKVPAMKWAYNLNNMTVDYNDYYRFTYSTALQSEIYKEEVGIRTECSLVQTPGVGEQASGTYWVL